ncbi:MAG: substrate-binding domain-containing protein, partial [Planctomycetales bacterium]
VIAVRTGNPQGIQSVSDLLKKGVSVAIGDPEAAAVGKKTRQLLSASGQWKALVQQAIVQKPTVNDIANAVKLGSVDAGVIWDSTAEQYPELSVIRVPEFEIGRSDIEIAVVRGSNNPTAALRFARYVAARDKGLLIFAAKGFTPVEGDKWSETPRLTLFAGAVNRQAIENALQDFQQREGVTIDTSFQGCGILTAQMQTIRRDQQSGFPDTYMACDVYYLDTVKDWFQDAVNISDTDIVLVVQNGNPKNILSLRDLIRPGVRIALGQPEQCTIGVLSRKLLQSESLYQKFRDSNNLETETATSAMLVPMVITGSVDAVLAYRSDTKAEHNRMTVVDIDSPLAKAIQPFSIARSSDFKHLSRRLFDRITRSREDFETAGFNWRLNGTFNGLPMKTDSYPSGQN